MGFTLKGRGGHERRGGGGRQEKKEQVRRAVGHSLQGFCVVSWKTCPCPLSVSHPVSPNLQHQEAGTLGRGGQERIRLSGNHKHPTVGLEVPQVAELEIVAELKLHGLEFRGVKTREGIWLLPGGKPSFP